MALRSFGTGGEALFSMTLLGRVVRVGPVALDSAKPPSVLRMLNVFFGSPARGNLQGRGPDRRSLRFLNGVDWASTCWAAERALTSWVALAMASASASGATRPGCGLFWWGLQSERTNQLICGF